MFQRNLSRKKETFSRFQISFDTQYNHFDDGLGLANNNTAIVVITQIFRFHFIELNDFRYIHSLPVKYSHVMFYRESKQKIPSTKSLSKPKIANEVRVGS